MTEITSFLLTGRPDRGTVLRMIAPLALMALIFYLSSQPSTADLAWWGVLARKLGHAAGYAALTALWAWALAGAARRPLAIAVAISLAYAASDEFHQSFVETRHATPVDVLIDSVGIAAAALVIRWRTGPPPGARR